MSQKSCTVVLSSEQDRLYLVLLDPHRRNGLSGLTIVESCLVSRSPKAAIHISVSGHIGQSRLSFCRLKGSVTSHNYDLSVQPPCECCTRVFFVELNHDLKYERKAILKSTIIKRFSIMTEAETLCIKHPQNAW